PSASSSPPVRAPRPPGNPAPAFRRRPADPARRSSTLRIPAGPGGRMTYESTFRFENPGLALSVYPDRLEIAVRNRQQVNPLTGVAEVLVASRPKRVIIVTTEGKRHELSLGRHCEEARAVIARQLAVAPR